MTKANDDNLKCTATNNSYQAGSFSDRVHRIIYSEYLQNEQERTNQLSERINELVGDQNPVVERQKRTDIAQWYDGLIWEFEIHFEEWLKENNWSTRSFHFWIDKWNRTAINIGLGGLPHVSELLYKSLYQVLRKHEPALGWVSKGTPLHQIGWSKLLKESPKAKSYFLLALIEDIIWEWKRGRNKGSFCNKPAYRVLRINFSEPKEYLDRFETVVSEFIKINKLKKDDLVYPEEMLVWYFSSPKFRERQSNCLDFDSNYADYLYQKLRNAKTNNEKGGFLEQLLAYILFSQSNFEVLCNLRGIKDETDLRLRNFESKDPFINELGRYILVEAKNTKKTIPVKEVNDFISNVRSGGCNSGILFSLKGVTGEKKNKDALYTIRQAYHKDKIIILIFREKDLKDIIHGVNFKDLLLEKYEQLRFDSWI